MSNTQINHPNLVSENSDALAWINETKLLYAGRTEFGDIASAVLWTNEKGPDGNQIIPIDPEAIVADINTNEIRLLKGHDPGHPIGKVLRASIFTNSNGIKFIACLLGYYQRGTPLGFRNLGIDPFPVAPSPLSLPEIPESSWIELLYDPRDVDSDWVEDVLKTAPIHAEGNRISLNSADSTSQLISLGLPFLALVWNPYVTSLATEAGKDSYKAIRNWLRRLLGKLVDQKNPILEIQSGLEDCRISFLFRDKDVKRNYIAHDALPEAAARAFVLAKSMNKAGLAPARIVYEFHKEDNIWFPSFAELYDGRLVTDNSILIAVENLPSGLSLGIKLS